MVFNHNTKKVRKVFQKADRLSKTLGGEWIDWGPAAPASAWEIADFNYPMIQGEAPIVKTGSEKAYLIQIMATWCKPCTEGRARLKEMLKGDLSDIAIQLLLVSVDEDEQVLRKYLNENQVTAPVAWDPSRSFEKPMNQQLIPKYLILKGKTVYPFDMPHYVGQSGEYYGDLAWFVRYHADTDSAPKH